MTLNTKMRAIQLTGRGGAEVLQLTERALPMPGPEDVLIKVHAAGLNRADLNHRNGHYTPGKDQSDLLGLEVAGEIVACGSAVTLWQPGQRVCAWCPGGGYAEYCIAPQVQVLPVPRGVDYVGAASLPIAYFAVWSAIFDVAAMDTGETLLVHGGTSGVGVAAIQLAVAKNHQVITTAGSPEKCAACVALGAAKAINYHTEDFVSETMAFTENRGVDVILDMVGGDYIPREIDTLAFRGRLVVISLLRGEHAPINFWPVISRRISIHGAMLRPVSNAFRGKIAQRLRERVWPLIEDRKIRPVIFRTFPLAEAANAHRLLEAGMHIGKIVLTMQ